MFDSTRAVAFCLGTSGMEAWAKVWLPFTKSELCCYTKTVVLIVKEAFLVLAEVNSF